jgi:hypothetical protein
MESRQDIILQSCTNYSNQDFSNTLITGFLTEVNLSGANLSNTTIKEAGLHGVDFSGANLSNATICADLSSSNFTNANLSNANLTTSFITGANFSGANFTGAVLDNVTFFPNLKGAFNDEEYRSVYAELKVEGRLGVFFAYIQEYKYLENPQLRPLVLKDLKRFFADCVINPSQHIKNEAYQFFGNKNGILNSVASNIHQFFTGTARNETPEQKELREFFETLKATPSPQFR